MDALFALLAILLLCVFFTLKCRVPAGLTPLVAVCTIIPWLMLCGLAGLLWPGAVLGGVLCIGLGAFALLHKRPKNWAAKLLYPATVFFVLAALGVILYLWVRKPVVSEWDEVSLWATSVKLLKINNHLYTTAKIGWAWTATQVPGLPLLGYFFQLFGGYAEWKIYAGYDVLMLAVIAALIGTLGFKQYKLAVPLGIIGLLTPWFFTVYTRAIYVDNTWITSYGDIPAGMVYGGVVLVYLGLRKQQAGLWPVLPVLMAAAIMKENSFVLALAAAGLIAADQLFFQPERAGQTAFGLTRLRKGQNNTQTGVENKAGGAKGFALRLWRAPLARRLAFALLLVVVTFGFYRLWSNHIATVIKASEAAGGTGKTEENDPIAMIPVALGALLGLAPAAEQFSRALEDLIDAFLHVEITMLPRITIREDLVLGSGVTVTVLVLGMFVAAALLTRDKRLRLRTLTAMVLSTLCLVGYYFVLLVSYGYVFTSVQAAELESYNRYVQPAYIFWFFIALGFLALAARDRQNERPYGLATGAVLALCAAMLLRTTALLQPQYTVLGYPETFYDQARATKTKAVLVVDTIEKDKGNAVSTHIFFLSQGDNGEGWFTYSYELLPLVLDYSGTLEREEDYGGGGGGRYGPPDYFEEEGSYPRYYNPYTFEQLAEYIEESGVGYLFADAVDDLFIDTYGQLFADGLAAAQNGETLLYRVTYDTGRLLLVPVEMEVEV